MCAETYQAGAGAVVDGQRHARVTRQVANVDGKAKPFYGGKRGGGGGGMRDGRKEEKRERVDELETFLSSRNGVTGRAVTAQDENALWLLGRAASVVQCPYRSRSRRSQSQCKRSASAST
jgi:hypothetical protein